MNAEATRTGKRADLRIAAALFLTCAGVYGLAAPGHLYLLDASFKLTWAENVVTYGQLHFDRDQIGNANRIGSYFYPGRNGDLYIHFPLGGLFCYIPVALVARAVNGLFPALVHEHVGYYLAALTNIPFAAAAAVLLFWLARRLGYGRRPAAAAALVFGLATPLFPYATYDFNEPVAAFFVLLSCFLVITRWEDRRPWWALAAGAALAFAFTVRYELVVFAVAAVLFWLLLVIRGAPRGPLLLYAASFAALAAVVPFYNWYARGAAGDFAYNTLPFFTNLVKVRFQPLERGGPLLFVARFVWVYFLSPNMHNVILYCPLLVFGVAGARALARRHGPRVLFLVVPSLALAVAVVVTTYSSWAWGLRYAFVFWFMLAAAGVLAPRRRRWVKVAYAACVAWGAALGVVAVLADYQLTQNDTACEILGDASQVNFRGWIPEGRVNPRYAQIPRQFQYAGFALARTFDYYVHGRRFVWTEPSRWSATDWEGNLVNVWPVYAQVQGGASALQVWPLYVFLVVVTWTAASWLKKLLAAEPAGP